MAPHLPPRLSPFSRAGRLALGQHPPSQHPTPHPASTTPSVVAIRRAAQTPATSLSPTDRPGGHPPGPIRHFLPVSILFSRTGEPSSNVAPILCWPSLLCRQNLAGPAIGDRVDALQAQGERGRQPTPPRLSPCVALCALCRQRVRLSACYVCVQGPLSTLPTPRRADVRCIRRKKVL